MLQKVVQVGGCRRAPMSLSGTVSHTHVLTTIGRSILVERLLAHGLAALIICLSSHVKKCVYLHRIGSSIC